jgi:hypothetical protein
VAEVAAVAEEAEAVAEVAAEQEASARVSRPVRAAEADEDDAPARHHGHVVVVTSLSAFSFFIFNNACICPAYLLFLCCYRVTYWYHTSNVKKKKEVMELCERGRATPPAHPKQTQFLHG